METELVFPVTHPRPAPNGAVPSPELPYLAAALHLHRASLAAAILSSSSPSAAAISALGDAHGAIGSFLVLLDPSPPPSLGGGGDEPMEEEVEEGMRECVLQSKRRKRHASPSWPLAAAERAAAEVSFVRPAASRSISSSISTLEASASSEALGGGGLVRAPRRSSIDLVFHFHA